MDNDQKPAGLGCNEGLGAWLPIASAPEHSNCPVVVFWRNEDGDEMHDFDYTEDGCWMKWHEHADHVHCVGGHGVSYTPPYTHWMPLPAPPEAPNPRLAGASGVMSNHR